MFFFWLEDSWSNTSNSTSSCGEILLSQSSDDIVTRDDVHKILSSLQKLLSKCLDESMERVENDHLVGLASFLADMHACRADMESSLCILQGDHVFLCKYSSLSSLQPAYNNLFLSIAAHDDVSKELSEGGVVVPPGQDQDKEKEKEKAEPKPDDKLEQEQEKAKENEVATPPVIAEKAKTEKSIFGPMFQQGRKTEPKKNTPRVDADGLTIIDFPAHEVPDYNSDLAPPYLKYSFVSHRDCKVVGHMRVKQVDRAKVDVEVYDAHAAKSWLSRVEKVLSSSFHLLAIVLLVVSFMLHRILQKNPLQSPLGNFSVC